MNIFDFLKYVFEKDLFMGLMVTGGFCLTLVFIMAILCDIIGYFTGK